MCTYVYKGEEVEKLVLNGWPQTNVVEYFLCIGPAKCTKASPPAMKMLLFSSIINAIILSYTIIRICTILHIYMQVSETEGLAELHSVLEIINSVYFQGISLVHRELSRMFFQESECAFNNPNVLNIEAS